ncbi:MAG: hypothetical protein WC725_04630 [Patescibacteria group bacterium]
MNLKKFNSEVDAHPEAKRIIKIQGLIITILIIGVMFSSFYKSSQANSINTTSYKLKEINNYIADYDKSREAFEQTTATKRMPVAIQDLDKLQNDILRLMQSYNLHIIGMTATAPADNQDIKSYEYKIFYNGEWRDIMNFLKNSSTYRFKGKLVLVNYKDVYLEATETTKLNGQLSYKTFVE